MEDRSFVIGQEFPDVKAFRAAVKETAIAQHFELHVIKSDLIRYLAKCAAEGCPWRIRAVKLCDAPTFTIKKFEGTHTCGRNAQFGHHQASVDWIVSFIEERLRANIDYKPKDILDDIHKQYGITIPYKQAWRAKERGLQAIFGSSEESYCLLPAYCEQIKKTNPGSIAEVSTTGLDNRFRSLFVSFYASLLGFLNGCLPIVCVGAIQLKSKYLGVLLSATSFDANGGFFPLAFGVIDSETEENWMWFLSELRKALDSKTDSIPELTFISNNQKGVSEAVGISFPTSSNAICIQHLSETLSKEFKNSMLVNLLRKAAYSTTTSGFREKMTEIAAVSSDAASWLRQFPPSTWALHTFQNTRYGHLSSNTNEFHKWILESIELPVIQVIMRIHDRTLNEFENRRSKSQTCDSILSPSAENRINEAIGTASTHRVLRSNSVEFEVISNDHRSNIINIETRSCSCYDWQLYGIPCSHGAAALMSSRKDVYEFAERFFSADNYRKTYLTVIHPICGEIKWRGDLGNEKERVVRPPKLRRPPGRPEKKRVCIDDINHAKHTVRCSQCNETGHYKTTCKQEVLKMK